MGRNDNKYLQSKNLQYTDESPQIDKKMIPTHKSLKLSEETPYKILANSVMSNDTAPYVNSPKPRVTYKFPNADKALEEMKESAKINRNYLADSNLQDEVPDSDILPKNRHSIRQNQQLAKQNYVDMNTNNKGPDLPRHYSRILTNSEHDFLKTNIRQSAFVFGSTENLLDDNPTQSNNNPKQQLQQHPQTQKIIKNSVDNPISNQERPDALAKLIKESHRKNKSLNAHVGVLGSSHSISETSLHTNRSGTKINDRLEEKKV